MRQSEPVARHLFCCCAQRALMLELSVVRRASPSQARDAFLDRYLCIGEAPSHSEPLLD